MWLLHPVASTSSPCPFFFPPSVPFSPSLPPILPQPQPWSMSLENKLRQSAFNPTLVTVPKFSALVFTPLFLCFSFSFSVSFFLVVQLVLITPPRYVVCLFGPRVWTVYLHRFCSTTTITNKEKSAETQKLLSDGWTWARTGGKTHGWF